MIWALAEKKNIIKDVWDLGKKEAQIPKGQAETFIVVENLSFTARVNIL